jgi:hypothetical protein
LQLIKETNERNCKDKTLIAKEFENLRVSLTVKEKEIIRGVDELNKQNVQMLTSFLEMVN